MQNGSTFVFGSSTSSSLVFDGNTFGNLIINTTAAPPAGANGFTINGNLTLNANLTIVATGTSNNIKGNISIVTGTLNFNPASAGTINLNGSAAQTITNAGTFTTATNGTWSVANNAGVSLGSNLAVSAGTLTVANGGIFNFSTFVLSGAGTFSVASGGTLKTSNTNGFGSSITTTTKTLNTGAKYEWNANTTTAFGSLTINTPADLTVNSNVTLDKPVSMTGVLTFGTGKLTKCSFKIAKLLLD
jgi:hypothetical protein